MLDVLAIGAHPDDVEIAMGGAIVGFVRSGLHVGILDLTNGEPTPFGSVEERRQEAEAARKVLGVEHRMTLDLPNRSLADTEEARRKVAEVIRLWRPQTLFIHYWDDAHPDHVAAARLCEAARFWAKLTRTDMAGEPFYPRRIFYFLSNHLRIHLKPAFILDVSDAVARKEQAVRCYHSQFVKGREDGGEAFFSQLRALGSYWGHLIDAAAGEPFATREEIGLRGIGELVR